MAEWNDYITVSDWEFTQTSWDQEYGSFTEYAVELSSELYDIALDQLDDIYLPASDSYIDFYARRYPDAIRIFATINEEFTTSGLFEEREIFFDDNISEIINDTPIEL